jgi:hypothetical protein
LLAGNVSLLQAGINAGSVDLHSASISIESNNAAWLLSSGAAVFDGSTTPGFAEIIGIPTFSFTELVARRGAVPNGDYKLGIACTRNGFTERYWQSSVTVSNSTPTGFSWVSSTLSVPLRIMSMMRCSRSLIFSRSISA